MTRQIILDTETTGLSPKNGDRIIEVGCVEVINRKLTGQVFHEYINPDMEVSYGAYQVHGISTEFLQDKPRFLQIAPQLKEFLLGAELVIHNAPFDVGFLEHEFSLIDDEFQNLDQYCTILDTLQLARQKHPGQKNNLDALCKRYHIDNSRRDKHGALLDAEILAELYLMMTGGQTTMALDVAQSEEKSVEIKETKEIIDLPVIKADEAALKSHQEYLEMIQARSDKCLWLSMTQGYEE